MLAHTGGVGTRSFIFLSEKLFYFFLGQCDYSDKFPKMFCSWRGMECSSTANFCHQCGQQLNLSRVSGMKNNKSSTRGLSLEMSVFAKARAQLLNMLFISTHLSVPHGENI